MTEPEISPDGQSMWNGSEWVPITNQSTNIQDSVVMGDVHSTTNHYHYDSLKCDVCGAKGSITILLCSSLNCENTYCNFCQDSRYKSQCGKCVELELSELQDHEREIELARIVEEERRRIWALIDLEEKNKAREQAWIQSRSLIVRVVKARYLSFPLMQLFLLLLTVALMGSKIFTNTGVIVLFGMMQFAFTLIAYNFSLSCDKSNLKQVLAGKALNRTRVIVTTPIVGLLFTIIFFLNQTMFELLLITFAVVMFSIYMSAKVTLN
jgi:hypothetical protein